MPVAWRCACTCSRSETVDIRLTLPAVAPDAAASGPAAEPIGEASETGLQTATLQAAARPQAALAAEPARPADPTLPAADVGNGFALPADQLMPVTLIGLQVQPGDAWPLTRQAIDAPVPPPDDEALARRPRDGDAPDESEPDAAAGEDAAQAADAAVDGAPDEGAWCQALARTLNDLLASPQPPAALLAAADQWSRGRCVVLACPQGLGAAGPGWAFVLRARRTMRPRGPVAQRFALTGHRVDARLQWAPERVALPWCQVRVVKEHHPRSGRQLVALDAAGTPVGEVPCEVQLGPVRARAPRWRQACVRIDALRSFWAALGGQWSALVLVCSRPLAGVREPEIVEA
jgi:hypothetical protein